MNLFPACLVVAVSFGVLGCHTRETKGSAPAASADLEQSGDAARAEPSGGFATATRAASDAAAALGGADRDGAQRVSKLAEATSSGGKDYQRLCATCHGVDAEGYVADHAPSLVNPMFLESATDAFLKMSIAGGRPGTSMGAYGTNFGGPLDAPALDALVHFLRTQGQPSVKLAPVPGGGQPALGAPIYERACKSCHGDLQARSDAIYLANGAFLKQASDPFIQHAILHGRPGTKMVSFAATLNAAEIANVIAYVRSFAKADAGAEQLPPPTGHEPLVLNPGGQEPEFTIRENRFVGVDQVNKALAAHRRMVIIDARPASEWMRVHVTGAVSIPYHQTDRLAEIPPDVWAIAYCACPHHLSGEIVDALIHRGHQKALILDEGINAWHRRGYPVKAARGVPPPAPERPASQAPQGARAPHLTQ